MWEILCAAAITLGGNNADQTYTWMEGRFGGRVVDELRNKQQLDLHKAAGFDAATDADLLKMTALCEPGSSIPIRSIDLNGAGVAGQAFKAWGRRCGPVLSVERIDLASNPLTAGALAGLASFPRLQALNVDSMATITSTELRALAHATPLLETLEAYHTGIDGDVFDALVGLPQLRYLALSQSTIGDDGVLRLAKIGRRFPALETLMLDDVGISAAALSAFDALPALKMVSVRGNGIDFAAIRDFYMRNLLSTVDLGGHEVGDAAILAALAAMPSPERIEKLDISGNSLTPAALDAVATFPRLKKLRWYNPFDRGDSNALLEAEDMARLNARRRDLGFPELTLAPFLHI